MSINVMSLYANDLLGLYIKFSLFIRILVFNFIRNLGVEMKFKSLLSKALLLTAVAFCSTGCGDDAKKRDASSSDTSVS